MTFKQSDIQPCAICHKGLMHAGIPLFYRIKLQRFGLDKQAIQRQTGLEMMLGRAAALAAVMGPNEDIAQPIDEPRTILICEMCTHENPVLMQAFLIEEQL
jgi:hypothetical protein